MIPMFLLWPVVVIVICAVVAFGIRRAVIARRMAMATTLIMACLVIGFLTGGLFAEMGIVDGSAGRGSRVHLVMLVSTAVMLSFAPVLLQRWPLTHIALAPIPTGCILLYVIVSIYSGGFFITDPEWRRSLFSPDVYLQWFGPLSLFLVVPWFIGMGIVSIIRRTTKTRANQPSEATR